MAGGGDTTEDHVGFCLPVLRLYLMRMTDSDNSQKAVLRALQSFQIASTLELLNKSWKWTMTKMSVSSRKVLSTGFSIRPRALSKAWKN